MSDYKIGRVISVSGDNITIGLLETGKGSGQTHTGVPENMVIRIPAGSGPASELIVGAPGSFIKIVIPGGMLLCMVTEAHTPDVIIKESSGAGSADDENSKVTLIRELPKRRISVITFGTIGSGGEFIPGCSTIRSSCRRASRYTNRSRNLKAAILRLWTSGAARTGN